MEYLTTSRIDEEEGDPSTFEQRQDPPGSQYLNFLSSETFPSTSSQRKSKSGVKMAQISEKTSKILNEYQAYIKEIESELSSDSGSVISQAKGDLVMPRDFVASSNIAAEHPPMRDVPLRRGWDYRDDEEEGTIIERGSDTYNGRGIRYSHSFFRSRKFKNAMGCMVLSVVAIVIGVTVTKRDVNSPNWEDWPPQQVEESVPSIENGMYQEEMTYSTAAKAYEPVFFGRTTENVYSGTTYQEALEFCGKQEGYGLCPFNAVCPLGVGTVPLGEVTEGGPSWNPVSDQSNEWVQLAADGKCTLFSQNYGRSPEWGTMGGNDHETRNLVCCKQADSGALPVASSTSSIPQQEDSTAGEGMSDMSQQGLNSNLDIELSMYLKAYEIYEPIFFDRTTENVYSGTTYQEALEFCGKQEGYGLCPFNAVCPLGVGSFPLGGEKEDGPSWNPVSNQSNEWVQLSADGRCTLYSLFYGRSPEWGTMGGNDHETRNLVCCKQADSGALPVASSTSSIPQQEDSAAGEKMSDVSQQGLNSDADLEHFNKQEMAFEMTFKTYEPIFFDRTTENVYSGTTYQEALEFCGKQEGYGLCPFNAVCPLGVGTVPLGEVTEGGPSWNPVSDQSNEWVQLSADGKCTLYSLFYGRSPEWGTMGGNDQETRNLACCKQADSGALPVASSTSSIPQQEDSTSLDSGAASTTGETAFEMEQEASFGMDQEKAFETVAKMYQHNFFGRTTDDIYSGTTYQEALEFCGKQEGYGLCPFDALCPMGAGNNPFGGVKEDGPSWNPVSNQSNEWVQLAADGKCTLYSQNYGRSPEWGIMGGNDHETRNLVCCKVRDIAK